MSNQQNLTLLDAVAATGAGSSFGGHGNKTITIDGITTATVEIQISGDNTNWHTIATATADGAYTANDTYAFIRAEVTAWTSGTITVKMAQEDFD